MSDFKYVAINEAIALSQSKECGDMADVWNVWEECLTGVAPVVDATAAYAFSMGNIDRFKTVVSDFSKALQDNAVEWPVSRFVMFVDTTKVGVERGFIPSGVRTGSVLAVKGSSGGNIDAFHIQVVQSGSFVKAAILDKGDNAIDKFNSFMLLTAVCMSSWMVSRNAEYVDGPAPRANRRRLSALASVRFRKVFIRPLRKREERYEITGDNCPLHHVRGHLRYVSKERPLFGNFNSEKCWGPFWISEHWRGDEDNGRIVQEYVVNQPDA
jgi:hypothetical protein